MEPLILTLDEIREQHCDLFGNKAVGLAELRRAGFSVPKGFALSTEAFQRHLRRAFGERWAALNDQSLDESEVRRVLEECLLDEELLRAIRRAWAELGGSGRLVAVRSSTTLEDDVALSGAGVQETQLGLATFDAVVDAILRVWSSFFSEKAKSYRQAFRREEDEFETFGVIVQRLVEADRAGVLFTTNPLKVEPGELVVNASYGLGELVLSGLVKPDTFVLCKQRRELVSQDIVTKSSMLVVSDGRLERQQVEPSLSREPSLSSDQLQQLLTLGLDIESRLGGARDIEFAFAGERLFVLQARAITGTCEAEVFHDEEPDTPARETDVWSNANVGEALPGVATPLTWSIASRYSERGFHRAFSALGCEVPEGSVLVGRFRGRIYLNITQFTEIASQVPLLSPEMLAELGGVQWPDGMEPPRSSFDLAAGFRLARRLPRTLKRLMTENLAIAGQVDALESRVIEGTATINQRNLVLLGDSLLERELCRVDELLEVTGDAMLTCGANSLGSFLLLKRLLRRWVGSRASKVVYELLAGSSDLESAKPGVALWHIAATLRNEPDSARILMDTELNELGVESFPKESRARLDLHRFLAAHGYRAVREAELSAPRWTEDPSLIFATLREYLRSGGPPPDRGLEQRAKAHRRAWMLLETELGAIRLTVVRHLVSMAQKYNRLRERMRARVTQVLGLYRTIALDVSRRLREEEAAFFLTIDELHGFLRGELSDTAARALPQLVAKRRRKYNYFKSLPGPPPTFVGTPGEAPAVRADRERVLRGLGASPGRVTGKARVLQDHREASHLRAGEILVVSCADVGWSPLFMLAGAVVTELGGALSHAAVVAREYGVPAVFGVEGATTTLRTGVEITVDGEGGLVLY